MRATHALLIALLSLPSVSLSAQIRGTLEGSPTQPRFTQAVNDPGAVTLRTVRIDCGPEIECGDVRLVTESAQEVAWTAAVLDGSVRFTEPADAPTGSIAVRYRTLRVILNPAGPPVASEDVGCETGSRDMIALMDKLTDDLAPAPVVVVDSLGHVLRLPRRPLDEGDLIHLYAIRGTEPAPRLSIRRVSAFREIETYPLIGEGSQIDTRNKEAVLNASDSRSEHCHVHQYALLENFRGGGAGQISINRAETKGGSRDTTRLGLVELAVRRTYRGALSLGIARSALEDPEFTAVGTDSMVVSRNGGERLLYTLFFTPFYSRRAAEDRTRPFYEYVTPQVGIVVDDVSSNILYGLNGEIPWLGLFAGIGGHTGRVTRIPSDGPRVGTSLRGTGRGVETEEVWSTRLYLSLSVDLRAASTFLSRITK